MISFIKKGITGINARNLDYIFEHNNRSKYPNADSKLATKEIAKSVGVNTPELLAVVEWQHQAKNLKTILADHASFVMKPDRGSGGGGILVIKDKLPIGYKKSSGGILSTSDLRFHCQNILSGMFSLGGLPDRAVIESMVVFDPVFDDISFQGVPDIRIIVLNEKPVMGMLRLPTQVSDGKANLHQGGLGVGIDMKTGQTTHAVQFNKYIKYHPETGQTLGERNVPNWQECLDIAVKIQKASGLGYVGVDIVLDQHKGPLVLEINARPGISIQIANKKGLKDAINEAHT